MESQVANPSAAALYEDALVYETGSAITASGALSAYSGAKTGRSPSDKRIVDEDSSNKEIWWGPVNKKMSPEVLPPFPFLHTFSHAPRLLTITLLLVARPHNRSPRRLWGRRQNNVTAPPSGCPGAQAGGSGTAARSLTHVHCFLLQITHFTHFRPRYRG